MEGRVRKLLAIPTRCLKQQIEFVKKIAPPLKRMYNHIHEGGDVMGWIIILILAICIYGIVKLIKWVTAPSYWHKYSGGYYINGRKELSQKDKKKIKKLQRKL